jgi:hypothetical protein
VTGAAEARATWDWPVVASEDLVFGHQGRPDLGLVPRYAEVTSPWSVRDFLVQRQRWLWRDIHAVRHRAVLPLVGVSALSIMQNGVHLESQPSRFARYGAKEL